MQHRYAWLLLAVIAAHVGELDGRRGGGGGRGGGGRGGGGSRGGSRGSSWGSSSGSGSRSSSGSRGGGGFSSVFGGGRKTPTTTRVGGNTYSSSKGSGIGSVLRSNKVKTGLAAAAAGYVTYKAGKALLGGAGYLMHGGNRYYYGPGYYNSYYGSRSGMLQCSYQLQDNGALSTFNNQPAYFQDMNGGEQRLRQVYFACRSSYQYCCGMDCCNYTTNGMSGLGVAIIVLLIICCCGCCIFGVMYKFFRSALDCILPSNDNPSHQDFDEGPMGAQAGNVEIGFKQNAYPSQPPAYNYS